MSTLFPGYESKSVDIVSGLIQIMEAEGVGHWRPLGDFPNDGLPAIFIGDPLQGPTHAIGINAYTVSTDDEPGVDLIGVQFYIRTSESTPMKALQTADKLEAIFHGREYQNLEGWHIPVMWRNSLANLGPNENNHYQMTDSYHLYVDIYRKAADNG